MNQRSKMGGFLAGIVLLAFMMFVILLATTMFGLPDGARNAAMIAAAVTALAVAI